MLGMADHYLAEFSSREICDLAGQVSTTIFAEA
jgi:hypothetical protein